MFEKIKNFLKEEYKKFDVENLEPEDNKNLSFKLAPSIVPEHLARYNFSIEQIKNGGNKDGKGIVILNLASARGYGSQMIKDALPESQVLSLELRPEYLEAQQKKYPKSKGEQVMASVGIIPLADQSVNVVDAFEILEHLDEQKNLVSESYRILKDDGMFIVSVPHPYSFNKEGKRKGISSNRHHFYEPSEEELFQLLKDSGFKDITKYGQTPVNKKISKVVEKISFALPIRPLWAWKKGRDTTVRINEGNHPEMINLTHIFLAKK